VFGLPRSYECRSPLQQRQTPEGRMPRRRAFEVDRILEAGNSVWTAEFEEGLFRRVEATATEAFEQAISPGDQASAHLHEAWLNAYGRHPDPSDAWDHAIKAVETVLTAIVEPSNSQATLGGGIGILRSQSSKWKLELRGRGRDQSVEPLVKMLELVWVDPNRHGSSNPEAPATIEEARALVHLAVTIVQWGRDGLIVKGSSQDT
jgi:hypothetical protein